MNLDQTSLRLFIAAVEEGSIAAAAAREHITAPAISKRIGELESLLRVPLLDRRHDGVRPTSAGSALLNLARRAVHYLDDVEVQMRDYASGARGQVRVFANISAITQFLPRDLAGFLDAYPLVKIHLEESNSGSTIKAVTENAADIGIFTQFPHGADLETLPYETDRLNLIVRADHPLASRKQISFADTLEWDYVGLRTGSAINMQLNRAALDINRPLKLRVQVTGFDALCQMVAAGLGIAVAPQGLIKLYVKRLGLREIPLSDQWAQRELRIAVRTASALPAAAQLLVRHLQESASAR